jgi:hypothetical protein
VLAVPWLCLSLDEVSLTGETIKNGLKTQVMA